VTALLYFFVAVIAAVLSTRAWMSDRNEPTRQAFLGVGWLVAVTYLSFALSLLPGLSGLRLLYMMGGTALPVVALWAIDRLFTPPQSAVSPTVYRLFVATAIVAPLTAGAHAFFYFDTPRSSPPEVLAGLFTFVVFGFVLWRLWEVHDATDLRVDRVRLRYLLGMIGGAVVMTLLEQLARNLGAVPDLAQLSLSSRGVVLQGAIPPVSALLTGVATYFLYHTIVLSRLLDMHELFSRLFTLVVSAFALVLVDGVTLVWFGTFTDHPLHSTFQIFLGSVLFLAAYEPLTEQVSWWSNRIFNQRGQQLTEVLVGLRMRLPGVISVDNLTETILARLHASGRVPVCTVYLWDPKLQAFANVGHRGFAEQRPLAAIAPKPFTDKFAQDDEPWYFRATVTRLARTDATWREVLALMDATRADLVVPFEVRGVVFGWMSLRDEDWSDGFSADEIERLRDIADLASVVLSNIRDFQALEEEHRLAALGAMAAGLAHEIRNPLAGIKGAAQYLQSETLPSESQDMLQVVIDEADRLNVVVSQFLDYARPFELRKAPDHVNALVTHVLSLVRAQGIPKNVQVVEELAGDLPAVPLDRVRLTQVLLNLIQNALQAMPDGGTLTVITRRRTNRALEPVVEIAVGDTGVGISAEDMGKLFIPFFTTKPTGTGLGLAICQRIVQAHGGEMDVASTRGVGATFLVRLPLPVEQTAEAAK
jgi:two-component system sensor histidine kinase HydH